MENFVNTIDLFGDEAVATAIIDRSITEFNDNVLTTLDQYAFHKCIALTSVNLPNVTSFGQYAFSNCTALTDVYLPNITTLGRYGFQNSTALTSVYFPKAESLGQYLFQGCTALTSAKFPSATKINDGLRGCTALTDVYFPIATEATSGAFYECTSLAFVDLPKMKKIANQVFYGCVSLKTVVLRSATLCTLSDTSTFYGVNASKSTPFYEGGTGGTLIVPRSLVESYKTATNWSVVIAWNPNNRVLALEDYTVDGTITGEIDWDKLNGGTT